MTKHVKYGGSTAGRTIACLGWHAQAADLPKGDTSSAYAQEGTALHTIMERLLLTDGLDPQTFLGQTVDGVVITQEHIVLVRKALDAWERLCKEYGVIEYDAEVWSEKAHPTGNVGGTLDIVARADGNTVIVADWKFGYNPVDPVENAQGLFYAMCGDEDSALDDIFAPEDPDDPEAGIPMERLVLAVIQPTADEALKVWETTPERLDSFTAVMLEAIDKAEAATKEDVHLLATGPHCKYCPAEHCCPLKTGLVDKSRRMEPTMLKDIGQALDVAKEMEAWIAAVRKRAHEQLEAGATVPGWKLVPKRPSRVYTDESEVEKLVAKSRKVRRAETHVEKLLSPAQMEKLYKEKDLNFEPIAEFIASVSSGTTLAPESDKRPAALSVKQVADAAARIA